MPETPSKSAVHSHTNRLALEKSPYLRQHMHNPVDWYPWGAEAFAKARQGNKPIFLSIGYSTCHWCHVMERESFEDEKIGALLKEHFVSIKLDREERPDVDKIYMTYVQATTGGGGWPMTVFLTPDLKPFFGGTYFPPERRMGRPSFRDLLERINDLWQTRRDEILQGANEAHTQLAAMSTQEADASFLLATGYLTNALNRFKAQYDPEHGGFDRQPKFPRPSVPRFVLQQGVRLGDADAVKMVLHTCDEMAAGGINDQLGGGFARYSVDRLWLVPHFEKMLYDNAQLVQLYLDAHLVSGEARHARVVRDILTYLLRDMTHPGGGFYSAEDADSEGHEGKFYCWTKPELEALLTAAEFKVVERRYGITEKGNFEDHSHPRPLKNLNVLSIVDPRLSADESKLLATARRKMFDRRAKRVRPHLDDKILASWNGLMLGALARAGAVLQDDTYLAAAEKNLAFLKAKLWDAKTRTLYHRWRDGERDSVQLLDAYAFLLHGVLQLYEATLKPGHLEFAIQLAEGMITRFHDERDGGFFQSGAGDPTLTMRLKEDYDGAEPSGNSVATLELLKLGKITDRKDLLAKAERTLKLLGRAIQNSPQVVPYLMSALDFQLHEPFRVVVTGDAGHAATRALGLAAHSVYQPNKVILGNTGPVEEFARTLKPENGPVVYLCTGTACQPPTKDARKVAEMLKTAGLLK